jgi:rubrerythrin
MEKEKFKEVIDFALEREKEAVQFYEDMQKIVRTKAAVETLKDLAAMERGHINMLMKFKPDDVVNFEPEKVTNLRLSDYMVKTIPTEASTFQDILVIAMKREEAAKNLYQKIAAEATDENVRNMFLKIAEQEAKHKFQLEQFYEDNILTEM